MSTPDGVQADFPLARLTTIRTGGHGDFFARPDSSEALVDLIRQFATDHNATPAQIALAWILAQHPTHVPIPGTTKLNRIEENLGAAGLALTSDDLQRLDQAAEAIEVAGDRYHPQMQKMIDR